MASIPLAVQPPPQPENPISQVGQALTLQNLIQAMRQRQQLMPGQLATQQNELQAGQLANTATSQENQIRQIGLNNQTLAQKALADPDFSKHLEEETSGGGTDQPSGQQPAAISLHPVAKVLSKYYGLPMLGPGGALEVSNTLL